MSTVLSKKNIPFIAIAVIGALLIATGLWWLFTRAGTTSITTYFDRSVGVYEGTDVRVLGVKVGEVTKVEPQGDQVRVDLRVDRGVDIPATAKAVQMAPSVVADRYVQLTPPYSGGDKMRSGSTIARESTATPVEVDKLYQSVQQLAEALGPNGANKNGAVSDLVTTGAQNLAGNGEALNASITQLSGAVNALNSYRGDLFDTVKNLQVFVTALAQNDDQVRQFNTQLSSLSSFLAGERENLGRAVSQLSVALGDVAVFVRDNRDKLSTDLNELVPTADLLAQNRNKIADVVTLLPLAISNVVNAYDAESGTLASRVNLPQTQDPASLICRLIDLKNLKPGDPDFEALGRQMQPIIDSCRTIVDQAANSVKSPTLNLPLGLLSGDNIQRAVVPGTVPGIPSPRLSGIDLPGLTAYSSGGGQ